MNHLDAHNYLTNKGAIFIAGFENKKQIKYALNCEMVGNKYYIMFAEYPKDYDYGYTVRAATFIDVEENIETGNKEFFFRYDKAVFPNIDEDYLPTFDYKIVEGTDKYQLYTYTK